MSCLVAGGKQHEKVGEGGREGRREEVREWEGEKEDNVREDLL